MQIKGTEKICIVRTTALGDVVHALSMVNAIKKKHPETHITWLLAPLSYEVVKHQPNIDNFIIFDGKKGITSWLELKKGLKQQRFDLAIIPQVSVRVNMITALIKADIKLGFDVKRARELNWLFTNTKIPHQTPKHVQDQFFEFLDYLGIDHHQPEWNITFTPDELAWQKAFFQNIKKPVISFVIATSDPKKDWPPKGYAAVMDHVDQHLGYQPMVIGGPSKREHAITDEILSYCHCEPIIALEKPVRHTMLQLHGSVLVVAPDTGPLHMAVAMGIPTISLYGASDPRRCGPYKQFQELLINKYANPVEENAPITRKLRPERMQQITPDDVIEKINLAVNSYLAS